MRTIATATVYGFIAGALAAIVLHAMFLLEGLVWGHGGAVGPMRIFATVMAGGVIIAFLRARDPASNFDSQIADSQSGRPEPFAKATNLAVLGIVSVAFGGAIGPEAGVIAVIAELSNLVAARIGRDVQERRLVRQIGIAGALGGLYGSPPGGAGYADSKPEAPWAHLFLAATTGVFGLVGTSNLLPGGHGLAIPLPVSAGSLLTDLPTLLLLLLPGLVGVAVAIFHLACRKGGGVLLSRLSGDIRLQVLAGSALFALVMAIWPELRFNGQAELARISADPVLVGAIMLLGVALLKGLAMALCLSAGWLGGPIMPLAFMGGCTGLAVAQLVPGLDPGLAAAVAVGATVTVGMGKPLVVLLVLVFTTTETKPLAIALGVGLGVVFNRFLPERPGH
ncbi:MAG: chloride channel protein [Pseudorhodobacter sp.]